MPPGGTRPHIGRRGRAPTRVVYGIKAGAFNCNLGRRVAHNSHAQSPGMNGLNFTDGYSESCMNNRPDFN